MRGFREHGAGGVTVDVDPDPHSAGKEERPGIEEPYRLVSGRARWPDGVKAGPQSSFRLRRPERGVPDRYALRRGQLARGRRGRWLGAPPWP